jgi:histidinol dehydrogenase
MKIWKKTDSGFSKALEELINRADVDYATHDATVRQIIDDVRNEGDSALLKYTNQFDRTDYELANIKVQPAEIKAAYEAVSSKEVEALKLAAEKIKRFHERQEQESWQYEENGVMLGQMVRPLKRVGIYVPGGKASYPSSILMNAMPAKVAGVDEIVMVSPTPGGKVRPHCLVAADLAGVDSIYKVGGAQAVAALAYGTKSIPKVDKIVGPGNIFVALAKRMVFGVVDIDMIAGPSEILIVADESARPNFVAADLLSQAEHDEEAVPILVTSSSSLSEQVVEELNRQKLTLNRKSIIETSLNDKCQIFIVSDVAEAVKLANQIAPEHLELAVESPEKWAKEIMNAGAVFLGHYTPEAIGDYLAGPNHVLPTSGTARFSSPLGVYDFLKKTSLISYSKETLRMVSDPCQTLAHLEDLDGHANAVKIRIEDRD